jgi:hypothetical protein
LALFGAAIDVDTVVPWLASLVCLLGVGFWLAREGARFKRVWDRLIEIARQGEAR